MGSACDMSDIDRFMRSSEGQVRLEKIRQSLVGRAIRQVIFSNETVRVGIHVELDDGNVADLSQAELDVDVLRLEFSKVLEREYYVDYPERRPA